MGEPNHRARALGPFFCAFRGFIPHFGIPYFPLQLFGGEMRLVESLASGVRGRCWGQSLAVRVSMVGRCKLLPFLIIHDGSPPF
jgi:hypothetical protein